MGNNELSIVLVHGAWGRPEMWQHVIDALGDLGELAIAADLPSACRADAQLADDVEHVRSLVTTPCTVLCGHSYGGAVITEAFADAPGVISLVYVAAFVPDVGETVFDWLMKRPIEGDPLELFDDGTSLPSGWGADDGRYDAGALARMRQLTLRRQALAPTVTPLSVTAWRTLPCTYLLAAEDTVIHPDTQREMATRAAMPIREIACDHVVNIARPEAVADVLRETAEQLR